MLSAFHGLTIQSDSSRFSDKIFRQERYINKSTKLSETIKKVNLPKVKCSGKMKTLSNVNPRVIKKKLSQARRQMDIA